jgi:hypothetical protein
MPTWLSDPPTSLYALLAAAGVLPLLAALFLFSKPASKRDPKVKKSSTRTYLFIASGVGFALLLTLFLCDRLYESDGEQIVRKLNEMSAGVRERNLDQTFRHVSDSFKFQSQTKASLRALGDRAIQSGEVTDIPIWDINVEDLNADSGIAIVNFRFKVTGSRFASENQWLAEATFSRESDAQWRMTKLRIFPLTGKRDEIFVLGL